MWFFRAPEASATIGQGPSASSTRAAAHGAAIRRRRTGVPSPKTPILELLERPPRGAAARATAGTSRAIRTGRSLIGQAAPAPSAVWQRHPAPTERRLLQAAPRSSAFGPRPSPLTTRTAANRRAVWARGPYAPSPPPTAPVLELFGRPSRGGEA
jgi:hypothetical protein